MNETLPIEAPHVLWDYRFSMSDLPRDSPVCRNISVLKYWQAVVSSELLKAVRQVHITNGLYSLPEGKEVQRFLTAEHEMPQPYEQETG